MKSTTSDMTIADSSENYCVLCDASYAVEVDVCATCGQPLLRLKQESDDITGTTLAGTYRLDGRIGNGGMGTVYRAVDTRTNATLAIKLIEAHLAKNVTNAKRFLREAKLASRLQHKNIVSLFNFGQSNDGVLFIAMELLHGQTLRELCQTQLTLGQAIDISIQITEALEAAHSIGIVHRDLKPDNVIQETNGNVKVLDFGLAKSLEDDDYGTITRSGIVLGTPNYISPELAKGEPADGRSDLYSVGVMLYEMICGHLPFKGESPPQVLALQAFAKPKPLPESTPAKAAQLVAALLEKDPADRPANAGRLLKMLIRVRSTLTEAEANRVVRQTESIASDLEPAPGMTLQIRKAGLGGRAKAAILLAALAVLAGTGFAIMRDSSPGAANATETRKTPPQPSPPTPSMAQLTINTEDGTPAKVFIDDKAYGSTPIVAEFKPDTTHELRLERQGYVTAKQSVTAKAGEQTLRVSLSKVTLTPPPLNNKSPASKNSKSAATSKAQSKSTKPKSADETAKSLEKSVFGD